MKFSGGLGLAAYAAPLPQESGSEGIGCDATDATRQNSRSAISDSRSVNASPQLIWSTRIVDRPIAVRPISTAPS